MVLTRRTKNHDNCLNVIRLIAAIQVMYEHYLVHLDVDMPRWIGQILSLFPGVPVFFALSGYLIWHSVGRSNSIQEYACKRFWRIFPELWIGIVVEIIVLLCFYWHEVDPIDLMLFSLAQSTVFQFWTPDSLRGYGCGVPNGSLWTICVIIQFYVVVWYIYKVLKGKKNAVWLTFLSVLVLISYVYASIDGMLPQILYKLGSQTVIPYLWLFMTGAYIAEKKDLLLAEIKKYWLVFVALAVGIRMLHLDFAVVNYSVLSTALLFCGWLGFAYSFPKINIKTDVSYGIYIYHMTAASAVIELGLTQKPAWMFIAMVVSCTAAYLSAMTMKYLKVRRAGG